MKVEWDVPIRMDDGVVLRADVFRHLATLGPAGYAPIAPFDDRQVIAGQL